MMKWWRFFTRGVPAEAEPPMATLAREAGNLHVIRIRGLVSQETVARIQAHARKDLEAGAESLKVLLLLDGFRGWRKGGRWDDLEFFAVYGPRISRIAVVGTPEFEIPVLMFLGAGKREGDVRYFLSGRESQARAWLQD